MGTEGLMAEAKSQRAVSIGAVNRPSLHLEIVPVLREMILTGALEQGAAINETELCQQLCVSKTPLREALKVLAFDRWVEIRQNRGTIVSRVTREEAINLFEVFEGVEFVVGTLAAQRVTDEEFEAVKELHGELGRLLRAKHAREYFEVSQKFHNAILHCTHNSHLIALHEDIARRILRARIVANVTDERRTTSYNEHGEILAALKARDSTRLGTALRNHAHQTGEAVIAALRTA
jgi:DNA-binding GntR family transcriptional regulator